MVYKPFGLALHLQHASDCNPCPSPHACLLPAPLMRRPYVQLGRLTRGITRHDTLWQISIRLLRPRQTTRQHDFPILNSRLIVNATASLLCIVTEILLVTPCLTIWLTWPWMTLDSSNTTVKQYLTLVVAGSLMVILVHAVSFEILAPSLGMFSVA